MTTIPPELTNIIGEYLQPKQKLPYVVSICNSNDSLSFLSFLSFPTINLYDKFEDVINAIETTFIGRHVYNTPMPVTIYNVCKINVYVTLSHKIGIVIFDCTDVTYESIRKTMLNLEWNESMYSTFEKPLV